MTNLTPTRHSTLDIRHLLPSPLHNPLLRILFPVARLAPFRVPTPRRHGMRIALPRFAFTAPVRMVHRVHGHAAHMRHASEPPGPARLARPERLVLRIAQLTERGPALQPNQPDLP